MALVKSKFRRVGYWFAGILAVALAFLQALPVFGKSRTENNVTSTGAQSTTSETDVLIATMLGEKQLL